MTGEELVTALCDAGVPWAALTTETAITATLPDRDGRVSIIERTDDDGVRWLVVRDRDRGGMHWFAEHHDLAEAVDVIAAMFRT